MLLDTYLERGARGPCPRRSGFGAAGAHGSALHVRAGRPRPGPSSWQPRGAPPGSLSQRGRAGWPPGTRPSGPRSGVEVEAVSTSVSPAMGNYPPSTWLKDARWPVTTMADDVNSSAGKAFGLTPGTRTSSSSTRPAPCAPGLRASRPSTACAGTLWPRCRRPSPPGAESRPRPTGECETPATLAAPACRG